MDSIEGITEATLQELNVAKSTTTAGIYTATGIQGVDLSGLVSLVPVNVPARNNTRAFPRTVTNPNRCGHQSR